MALTEGMCPNCGSLIQIDPEKKDQHCIFCWAPVDPDFAQSLLFDPKGHEFPNEEFPQPTAQERQAYMLEQMGQSQAAAKVLKQQPPARKKKKEDKISPAEKVRLMTRPIVEPVASKRSRKYMLAIILGAVLIFAAIFTPLYLRRMSKREALQSRLDDVFPFPVEDEHVQLERQDNRYLLVVSPQDVDAQTADTVYANYAKVYADTYEISEADALKKVEVEVLGPSGGYVLSEDGRSERRDLEAPPTQEAPATTPATDDEA